VKEEKRQSEKTLRGGLKPKKDTHSGGKGFRIPNSGPFLSKGARVPDEGGGPPGRSAVFSRGDRERIQKKGLVVW